MFSCFRSVSFLPHIFVYSSFNYFTFQFHHTCSQNYNAHLWSITSLCILFNMYLSLLMQISTNLWSQLIQTRCPTKTDGLSCRWLPQCAHCCHRLPSTASYLGEDYKTSFSPVIARIEACCLSQQWLPLVLKSFRGISFSWSGRYSWCYGQ